MTDHYKPVEYTPTTDEVRDIYAAPFSVEEFDRWLAAHDAEVAASALREALSKPQTCARCGVAPDGTYWPTCADVVYRHPDEPKWASLHDVVCWYIADEGMGVCDGCDAELHASFPGS